MLTIALSVALSANLFAAGAESSPALDGCRRCKFRGVVACDEHDDDLRELEATVYCSVAARCEPCGGALLVDCEHCEGGPDNAAMEARRAELAAWLAVPHPLEEQLGMELIRVEDDRFLFAGRVDRLKRGRKRVDGHHFFHHLARDAAHTARLVDEHYAVVPDEDYRAQMRLWLWQDPADHAKVMREYLLSSSTGDYKLLGKDPIFSACTSDAIFENEHDVLVALGVHNAAHMLTSNLFVERWIGLDGAGWFDAGLAHWYEREVVGEHRHYCVDEAHGPWKWTDEDWRVDVRKFLAKRDERVWTELVGMQTGELPDWGHAMSWSLYDWLVATKPEALRPLLEDLKALKPARDAVKERVGMDLLTAEAAWREWVVETYPRK